VVDLEVMNKLRDVRVVSRAEWLLARKTLLAKEKASSRERDALSAERRKLPMVKIDEPYAFDAPAGRRTLRDLFGPYPQLIVYHFMLDPSWESGCKSCSLIADNIEGGFVHFAARDTAFTMVSRAPLARIEAFKARMGWTFPWVSSSTNEFNYDFGVSFRTDADGGAYNYGAPGSGDGEAGERPGLSCFLREGDDVFHTYSTYARGLDLLIGTYHYLDLTPLGRHEEELPYGMAWVKHHDKYV
jgi:predicted dithiol-disulfide oxidoreductase (DUF899 family)